MENKKSFWAAASKACLALVVICGISSCNEETEGLRHVVTQSSVTTVDGFSGFYIEPAGDVLQGTEVTAQPTKNGADMSETISAPITQAWEKDNYESLSIDATELDSERKLADGNCLNVNPGNKSVVIDGVPVRLENKVTEISVENEEVTPHDGESRRVRTTATIKYHSDLFVNGDKVAWKDFTKSSSMERFVKKEDDKPQPTTVVLSDFSFLTTNTTNTVNVSYNDGTNTVNAKFVFNRSAEVITSWTMKEKDNTQSTSAVRVESTNSANKSATQNGIVCNYKEVTTIYSTVTTLKDGSTQRNAVRVVEQVSGSTSYKGVVKDFSFQPSMTADRGKISFSRETSEGTVYNFVNIFTYSFNNNVQTLQPQGSIIVEKEEETITPTFPGIGLLKNANFTANLLEGYQVWGIGGAFNCTNGTVCIWTDKNVSKLNVFKSALVSNEYNSTCWSLKEKTYVPAVAKNASAMMTWCNAQGQTVNALAYTTAQTFHFNNNHNTVVNNRLKKTIENKTTRSGKKYQIVQIIDTQNSNKVLATWTFCE